MQFDSLSAFIDMGGHGAFVWAAYTMTACVMAGNVMASVLRKRTALQEISRQIRREEQSL